MALLDILSFSPKGKIGNMEIAATLQEIHSDTLQMTEHPVEYGAAITDHAFVRPKEVIIRCGWSNSTLSNLLSTISGILGTTQTSSSSSKFSGEMAASGYIAQVYDYLLTLQDSRQPFDVTTSKRHYSNMLLTSLQVTTDQTTSAVLMVQATCRQIIIVKTQVTTVPPKSAQASPSKTAGLLDKGVAMLKSAAPSSVGSIVSKVSSVASTAGSISSGISQAQSLIGKFS